MRVGYIPHKLRYYTSLKERDVDSSNTTSMQVGPSKIPNYTRKNREPYRNGRSSNVQEEGNDAVLKKLPHRGDFRLLDIEASFYYDAIY